MGVAGGERKASIGSDFKSDNYYYLANDWGIKLEKRLPTEYGKYKKNSYM